jgi:outer membrane protein OmpA-like peptidoglycan-associated protein
VFAQTAPITQQVSKRSWHIEFDTGSATIKPESMDQLYNIEDTAAITNLRLRIDGYTDNTGSAAINIPLSDKRAAAVAEWLNQKAPANFPKTRMESRGHGPNDPVCPANDSEACKAQNRRVEITLGQ